jgi:hypothetical protein
MIDQVQDHLEAIYDFRCPERARAYVLDEAAASQLGAGRAREELWVHQEGEELSLGLYFAPGLLEELETRPFGGVVDSALASYCELAEGVSHFLYLSQAAQAERTVSLLELEAQAEIDKFASCLLHRWADARAWAGELHRRLFDQVRFRGDLEDAERQRYERANRLARNYCSRLVPFALGQRLDRLLTELRYAYRLGAAAKLDYLAQPA